MKTQSVEEGQLTRKLRELCNLWGLRPFGGNVDQIAATGDLLKEEAVLHEMAHAVVEDISLDKRAVGLITDRFSNLNYANPILGLVHEAQALAVEFHVLQKLGLLHHVRFDKIIKLSWSFGDPCPKRASLPLKTFRELYEKFRHSCLVHRQADQVVHYVLGQVSGTTAS